MISGPDQCPFCGGKLEWQETAEIRCDYGHDIIGHVWVVTCLQCGASRKTAYAGDPEGGWHRPFGWGAKSA